MKNLLMISLMCVGGFSLHAMEPAPKRQKVENTTTTTATTTTTSHVETQAEEYNESGIPSLSQLAYNQIMKNCFSWVDSNDLPLFKKNFTNLVSRVTIFIDCKELILKIISYAEEKKKPEFVNHILLHLVVLFPQDQASQVLDNYISGQRDKWFQKSLSAFEQLKANYSGGFRYYGGGGLTSCESAFFRTLGDPELTPEQFKCLCKIAKDIKLHPFTIVNMEENPPFSNGAFAIEGLLVARNYDLFKKFLDNPGLLGTSGATFNPEMKADNGENILWSAIWHHAPLDIIKYLVEEKKIKVKGGSPNGEKEDIEWAHDDAVKKYLQQKLLEE